MPWSTPAGCEIITAEVPKTVAEIEALMRGASLPRAAARRRSTSRYRRRAGWLGVDIALRDSGLSVLLLEARGARGSDRRSIALSFGSRLILERLEAWSELPTPTPIESIHASQRGGFDARCCKPPMPACRRSAMW